MRLKEYWFLLLAVYLLIYHFIGFAGFFGYDDLLYSNIAADIVHGKPYPVHEHFAFRWTVIYPLALSYLLFGINDFASFLPFYLYTLATIYLIYRSTKKEDDFSFILISSLVALNRWSLFYSDKVMPDIVVAFFVALAVFSYLEYKSENTPGSIPKAILFAFAVFMAFVTKGSVVLFIPVITALFIYDITQKQFRFWVYAFFSVCLFLITYFGINEVFLGSWKARFTAIELNRYFHYCAYELLPNIETWQRIGYKFWVMLIEAGGIAPVIIALVFLIYKNHFRVGTPAFLLILVSLLSANFMTISLVDYVPMCPDIRHYLFIFPVIGLSLSRIEMKSLYQSKSLLFLLVAGLVIGSFAAYIQAAESLIFCLLLIIGIIAFYFTRREKAFQIPLIIALFIPGWMLIAQVRKKDYYGNQKEGITALIEVAGEQSVIITNHVQKKLGDYYLDYERPGFFMEYDSICSSGTSINPQKKYFIFSCGNTRFLSKKGHEDLPQFVRERKGIELIDSTGFYESYQITDLNVLKECP